MEHSIFFFIDWDNLWFKSSIYLCHFPIVPLLCSPSLNLRFFHVLIFRSSLSICFFIFDRLRIFEIQTIYNRSALIWWVLVFCFYHFIFDVLNIVSYFWSIKLLRVLVRVWIIKAFAMPNESLLTSAILFRSSLIWSTLN